MSEREDAQNRAASRDDVDGAAHAGARVRNMAAVFDDLNPTQPTTGRFWIFSTEPGAGQNDSHE